MSVPVPLADLAQTIQRYPLAYLLTVGEEQSVHAVAVAATVDGSRLRVPRLGRRSLVNSEQHRSVTLLWPPTDPEGYTLIVDGTAEHRDDGVLVSPTRAVLHRAAATPGTAHPEDGACASDCVELPLGSGSADA